VPILILFLALQRRIVAGLTAGALKLAVRNESRPP
jgi:ABC-type maltose transport system permease subunit